MTIHQALHAPAPVKPFKDHDLVPATTSFEGVGYERKPCRDASGAPVAPTVWEL